MYVLIIQGQGYGRQREGKERPSSANQKIRNGFLSFGVVSLRKVVCVTERHAVSSFSPFVAEQMPKQLYAPDEIRTDQCG